MTEEDEVVPALLKGTPDGAPTATEQNYSALERIAALERQVEMLITLANAVHGTRWMDELKGRNEPASGE